MEIIQQRHQSTTQQPHQTLEQHNVAATKDPLTVDQPKGTPKIVKCPDKHH